MKRPLSLHALALRAHRDSGRLVRGEETEILFPKHSLPHTSKYRGNVREPEEPALSAPLQPSTDGGRGRSQRPSLSPPSPPPQAKQVVFCKLFLLGAWRCQSSHELCLREL